MVRSFLFAFFLIFVSLGVDAATPPPVSECGIEQGNVIPGDGTLCKNDIAFGMLFEMFPSIFREIGPLWNLTAFSQLGDGFEDQDLLGQYHGDQVFTILYKLFRNLVILCAVTYLIFLAVDIVSRLVRGKSLSDDDPGKDNNKSWAIGGSVGVLFMLPYKQFFIGVILVFSFAVGALSMANFVLSLFLSAQQGLLTSSAQQDRTTFNHPNMIERHDYIANNYYRYLVSMALCRRESASYIMTTAGGSAEGPEQYRKWHTCAKGAEGEFRTFNNKEQGTPPAFVSIREEYLMSPITRDMLISEASGIEFGGSWSGTKLCEELGQLSPEYYCGSILIAEPDWGSNPLLGLMTQSHMLLNSLNSLAGAISPTTPARDIENIVHQHWMRFYDDISELLLENINRIQAESNADFAQSDLIARQKAAARQALLDQNGHAFRQLARFYHQSAENILAFGRMTTYRQVGVDIDPVNGAHQIRVPTKMEGPGQGMGNLFYHLNIAELIADKIQKVQCLNDVNSLRQAKRTADFLNGRVSSLAADSHAKCLDVMKGEVISYNDAISNMTPEELDTYTQAYTTSMETELLQEWERAVSSYAAQRRAIEHSFSRYVRDYDMGNWTLKMRQEGYLSVAGFTFQMTSKIESVKREIKQIVNHFELRSPGYDSRYLGSGLHETIAVGGVFSPYVAGDELFQKTAIKDKTIDPFVDRYFWLVQQSMLLRQPLLARSNDWDFGRILDNMSLPLTGLKRLGMDFSGEKDWELCPNDPSKCPFPITDPMLELSLMGHDMVDSGIAFYTLAIGMKGIGSLASQSMKTNFKGTVTDRSHTTGVKMGGGAVASMLKDFGGMADLMFTIMGSVLLLYIAIGALLAYLLPLLPFIYIYMGFIAWVMVVIMASFSILLWCFFWVRFQEKRDLLKEAGFHYGVDMLFKPTFNLLSVLFAWVVFYVLMFVVGMTSNWISILPLSGEGAFGLRALIDPLFILLFIGFVYAMALKFSYNVMDEMSGELLSKLGVRNKAVKDNISTFIKAMLYDTVMEKGRAANQKLSGAGKDQETQQKAMENMRAVQAAQRAQREQQQAAQEKQNDENGKGGNNT